MLCSLSLNYHQRKHVSSIITDSYHYSIKSTKPAYGRKKKGQKHAFKKPHSYKHYKDFDIDNHCEFCGELGCSNPACCINDEYSLYSWWTDWDFSNMDSQESQYLPFDLASLYTSFYDSEAEWFADPDNVWYDLDSPLSCATSRINIWEQSSICSTTCITDNGDNDSDIEAEWDSAFMCSEDCESNTY